MMTNKQNKIKRTLIRTIDGNILLVDVVDDDDNFLYCKNVYLGVFSEKYKNKITQWRTDLYFGQQNDPSAIISISKRAIVATTRPKNTTGAYVSEVPDSW